MNVKEAYRTTNGILTHFGQEPIAVPNTGDDRSKIEYLLNEYARRLKKRFWRYWIYTNNRQIPEMVCQYLGRMLTADDGK